MTINHPNPQDMGAAEAYQVIADRMARILEEHGDKPASVVLEWMLGDVRAMESKHIERAMDRRGDCACGPRCNGGR